MKHAILFFVGPITANLLFHSAAAQSSFWTATETTLRGSRLSDLADTTYLLPWDLEALKLRETRQARQWWTDGSLASQGALPPTWLERWTGEPWIFTRGNSLYYWNYDKPVEVVLAPESLSAQSVAVRGYAMVRMGSIAAAVALP